MVWISSVLPIGAAVVTAGAALLAMRFTNRANNDRLLLQLDREAAKERAQMLREKGEELYGLIAQWEANFGVRCVSLQAVMKDELTYNEALDIFSKEVQTETHERVELLIYAYFPALEQFYSEIIAIRGPVEEIISAHKAAYKQGSSGRVFLKPFTDANLTLAKAFEVLKSATITQIKNIG